MTNEKEFEKRFGKRQPFKVPEGYFEDFERQLMAQLPEEEAKVVEMRPETKGRSIFRRIALAAASVCAAVFIVGAALHVQGGNGATDSAVAMQDKYATSYSAIDMAADYVMMDNEDIYAYVSEN